MLIVLFGLAATTMAAQGMGRSLARGPSMTSMVVNQLKQIADGGDLEKAIDEATRASASSAEEPRREHMLILACSVPTVLLGIVAFVLLLPRGKR